MTERFWLGVSWEVGVKVSARAGGSSSMVATHGLASKCQLSAADPRSSSHGPLSGNLNVLMMWTGFSRDERGEGDVGEGAAEAARPTASSQKARSIVSTARFTGRESLSPARIRKREEVGSIFCRDDCQRHV